MIYTRPSRDTPVLRRRIATTSNLKLPIAVLTANKQVHAEAIEVLYKTCIIRANARTLLDLSIHGDFCSRVGHVQIVDYIRAGATSRDDCGFSHPDFARALHLARELSRIKKTEVFSGNLGLFRSSYHGYVN